MNTVAANPIRGQDDGDYSHSFSGLSHVKMMALLLSMDIYNSKSGDRAPAPDTDHILAFCLLQ